ncbi:hypothetical protein F4801DRAFT_583720 [Xylaria longipes]|nr:hypothetical protein F4801DRAFT_583720 [Xylaria longipes]
MPPHGEVFGDAYFGNANAVLSDNAYAHEANQAPRPWCENTHVLESLTTMPQMSVDSIISANNNILPNCPEISQYYPCHNHGLWSLPTTDIMTGQPGHSDIPVLASVAPCDFSQTQPIDPILQQFNITSSTEWREHSHGYLCKQHGQSANSCVSKSK